VLANTLTLGKNTTGAFLVPQSLASSRGDVVPNVVEVVDYAGGKSSWDRAAEIITEAKFQPTPPLQMFAFILGREGGRSPTMGWAGMQLINFGIDWTHVQGHTMLTFDEEMTSGSRLSMSRGWGPTATTYFDNDNVVDADIGLQAQQKTNTEILRKYAYRSGIPYADVNVRKPPSIMTPAEDPNEQASDPEGLDVAPPTPKPNPPTPSPASKVASDPHTRPWPAIISDANSNVRNGLDLLVGKFNSGKNKQQCTFSQRLRDCNNCLKQPLIGGQPQQKKFNVVYVMENGKIKLDVAHNSCHVIDQTQSDFVSLAGGTSYMYTGESSGGASSSVECIEYPCSWLRAAMGYAGAGPQAFARAMDIIDELPKNSYTTKQTNWP
jgi:hypothetical protein